MLWFLLFAAIADPVDLSGTWQQRLAEDHAESIADTEHGGWQDVVLPGSWHQPDDGLAVSWLRRRIDLPAQLPRDGLALLIYDVYSSYALFVDGEHLGTVGALPPQPQPAYGVRTVHPIPASLTADGAIEVTLKVWHGTGPAGVPAGVRGGELLLGGTTELTRRIMRADLQRHLLGGVIGTIALYHLLLWFRRREQLDYLGFAAFAGSMAIYLSGRTQLPMETFGWETTKRLQLAMQFISPVTAAWFTVQFLRVRAAGVLTLLVTLSAASVLLAVVLPILPLVNFAGRQALLALAVGVLCTVVVFRAAWRNEPEARIFAVGFSAALLAATLDSAIYAGWRVGAFVLPWGILALVVCMAASLSERFVRVHGELDALNRELERRVGHRTQQLAELNANLARRVKEQVQEILRRGRLDRYFSSPILERLLHSEDDLADQPQRAVVTLLFADLAGFTALSDAQPPDVVHRVLDDYLRAMIDLVEEAGATLDKLMGDGVMVILGAPKPLSRAEQARAAVALGLAMQDALRRLREGWAAAGLPSELELRVGVHQDEVTIGHFGTSSLVTYTAIGKGVNLASRLESACPPGAVLISDVVRELLPEEMHELTPRTVRLKGIADPFKAWVVSPRRERVAGGSRRGGRDAAEAC